MESMSAYSSALWCKRHRAPFYGPSDLEACERNQAAECATFGDIVSGFRPSREPLSASARGARTRKRNLPTLQRRNAPTLLGGPQSDVVRGTHVFLLANPHRQKDTLL